MPEIDELFGLPAHPLVVHVPVVLLPLAALGVVIMAVSPRFRRGVGWVVVALTGLASACALLALNTGAALEERVEDIGSEHLIEEHGDIGERAAFIACAFFVIMLAWMLFTSWRDRQQVPTTGEPAWRRWVAIGLTALSLAFAAVTAAAIVRTGHSGAEATWERTEDQIEQDGGDGEGDEEHEDEDD